MTTALQDTTTALHNTLAGRLVVEELVRLGIGDLVVAPGSRSTPLADAAARHPRVRLHVRVDERAAAFFALGIGRATGRAAALITTSGSAAGHALPAVIEADAARVPLLILSADRPPELRGTGANQTIDQVHLFGARVRLFVDVACPDAAAPLRALLTTIDHAVAASADGPVHLNLMFRKPLGPVGPEGLARLVAAVAPDEARAPGLRRWLEGAQPYARWQPAQQRPTEAGIGALIAALDSADTGVLVVGALDDVAERAAAVALAAQLGWPVVADIASGLRLGPSIAGLLPFQQVMLASARWAMETRPDVVLQVGGPLVSQAVQDWLATSAPLHHIVARPDGVRFDPGHSVTLRLQTHVSGLCAALDGRWSPSSSLGHLRRWQAIGHEVAAGMRALDGDEIAIARSVCAALPANAGLWAASSMSVRLLDAFAPAGGAPVVVASARGASGIDGLIAQATGWSLARGQPTVLLIGDLAALHDVGALQLLAATSPDLVVVVVNNAGGGIFSLLPIREQSAQFEPVFAAAHDQRVSPWARAAGVATTALVNALELPGALAAALSDGGPHVIEVHTDRESARIAWRAAHAAVAQWVDHHLDAQADG